MDKTNFSAFCLVLLVAIALAVCGVLLINCSTNIAYADSIIDLTGYTWDASNSFDTDFPYNTELYLNNIVFTSNANSYTGLTIVYYYDNFDESVIGPSLQYDNISAFSYGSWSDNNYKHISFVSGSDLTNSSLISFFQTTGTLTAPSSPEPDEPSYPDEPDEPSEPSQDYLDGYEQGFNDGRGSIYTGVLSDYTILSDYSTLGINNNSLNISDSSETLDSIVMYSNFTINGYTINYGRYDIVGSDDNTGNFTLTLTGSTGYSGYKISSFNIDENTLYKFMFNPEDSFNICISVPDNGSYLYWTYSLQTNGYINGVPYMDLTPYIKPWASHTSCDIYLYNPNLRLIGSSPVPLVLHNTTPIYGLVGNNLIIDNSNGNYNQGFKDGQVQGEQIGFANGWNKAINSSSNNFLGLFSAVLDAPVNVISQTLDFDLLGFNLKDFFFSMVSIAVILFILRLIL